MEESPSPAVSPELRARLGEEAVALARAAGYVNVGTVEFIADRDDPAEHYFLEVNARLQVEHPVTEAVTGLDLVELQLRIAAGEPLPVSQDDVVLRGHAIEARVCAEDAARDFLPAAGRVLAYDRAPAPGVRVDDGIAVGMVIDTAYDSLVAKVIAHGADRPTALARLDHALARTTILGVTTTTGYLRALLGTDEVRDGRLDTELIERLGPLAAPLNDADVARAAARIRLARAGESGDDPFDRTDGWRLGGSRAGSHWRLAVGGGDPVEVHVDGPAQPLGDGRHRVDGRVWSATGAWVGCEGHAWPVRAASAAHAVGGTADGQLRAPMPGQVLIVGAAEGDAVTAGDPIVVLESMKMELVLAAPADGTVTELTVAVGDTVSLDQPLARVR
jgi:acetyl-CoA/propionyl-CoA carboxylase biotin carboxyl carrier protein